LRAAAGSQGGVVDAPLLSLQGNAGCGILQPWQLPLALRLLLLLRWRRRMCCGLPTGCGSSIIQWRSSLGCCRQLPCPQLERSGIKA
jgi:hypothetical protein